MEHYATGAGDGELVTIPRWLCGVGGQEACAAMIANVTSKAIEAAMIKGHSSSPPGQAERNHPERR